MSPKSKQSHHQRFWWPKYVLGPLEAEVMAILWESAESTVRQIEKRLDRKIAYTTVMTTLDRLHRKGLLKRRMAARAFLYSPRLTPEQWQRLAAHDVVSQFLSRPNASRELLLTCLRDVITEVELTGAQRAGQKDSAMELERQPNGSHQGDCFSLPLSPHTLRSTRRWKLS